MVLTGHFVFGVFAEVSVFSGGGDGFFIFWDFFADERVVFFFAGIEGVF